MLARRELTVIRDGDPPVADSYELAQTTRVFYNKPRDEIWFPRKKGFDLFSLSTGEPLTTVDGLPRPLFLLIPPPE